MRLKIFIPAIIFIFSAIITKAQCKEYIKSIAPDALAPYILDGNFFAPVVYEGEKVTLTRTFLAHKKYKIAVIGMDFFEKNIIIKDEDGFIIFKNFKSRKHEKDHYYTDYEGNKINCEGSNVWEFELDRSQNLTIIVQLEQKAKKKKFRLQGCLGIVIGFKE
jgi:hypothetical protein